jgi:L-asparaginase
MVLNHFLQKFQRRTEYEEKLKSSGTGTVGCVALIKTENSGSHISGGKGFEVPGRISDSATVAEIMLILLWC